MKKTKYTLMTAATFAAAIQLSANANAAVLNTDSSPVDVLRNSEEKSDTNNVTDISSDSLSDYITTTVPKLDSMPMPVYGPPEIFYQQGDLNGDKEIDVFDIIVMKKRLSTPDLADYLKSLSDINGDNEFNIADLVTLNKFILGESKNFYAPNEEQPQPDYGPVPVYTTAPEEDDIITTTTHMEVTLYGPPTDYD